MGRGKLDPARMPLTFDILSDGNITWKFGYGSTGRTIEYSKNGGAWTSITSTSAGVNIPVIAGDELRFRGNAWTATSDANYSKFAATCSFAAKGNPASLKYGENLTGDEALYSYCYYGLFRDCTSLTAAPDLPATTLADECYDSMFTGCTGLTEAPDLPATTLAVKCYEYMFQNCSSLILAPELEATTLMSSCYYRMFYGCSQLGQIICTATDISASSALSSWLSGVAAQGTFYKAQGVSWPSGASGIPSGWTVIEV